MVVTVFVFNFPLGSEEVVVVGDVVGYCLEVLLVEVWGCVDLVDFVEMISEDIRCVQVRG